MRFPSEAIFKSSLNVETSYGVPMSAGVGSLAMDVDRNLSLAKAFDGDGYKKYEFMRYSGINSSAFEHSVPEQLFSTPDAPVYGISAVKALQIANDTGVPIYEISSANVDTVIPQLELDANVISEIRNAVNAGNIVMASKTNIEFHGWTGCGYVILNPTTGAGAYMISGGDSGAWLIMFGVAAILAGFAPLGIILIVAGVAALAMGLALSIDDPVGKGDECGSKTDNSGWVPDIPFGVDMRGACVSHDACYASGGLTPKQQCDTSLRLNIMDSCLSDGVSIVACEALSTGYMLAVMIFGGRAYNANK